MIGFSSIAQLGLVFIGFSIPGPWGVLAGLAEQGSGMHLVALGAVLLGSVIKAHYLFRFAL